jgi:carboxyvinyl-carboxyphosphonate phosphorylmutase
MADVSLMLDGEEGFGNAVNTMRTIKELESVGVSAIEIEDNIARTQFVGEDPGLFSKAEQVGKLEAAVAARIDPGTVIVARASVLNYCPMDEALDRISAYSQTGVEAVRLTGLKTREQLEAIHQATPLPLTVLSPPDDMRNDPEFMAANGVRILMAGNPAYGMAVKAVYDCFKHLKEGGDVAELASSEAPAALLREVNRTDEFIEMQEKYMRA